MNSSSIFSWVVAATTLGSFFTQEAEAQTTLHLCYVPATGIVYRTDTPGECKGMSHVAFDLTDAVGADHGRLTGLQDDEDHPQYILLDGVRKSTDGFAVTSDNNTGTIPVTGPGNRVMWYAKKAAFRAGRLVHEPDGWDDARVGLISVAMGIDPVASGPFSVALGNSNSATEHSAVALGSSSVASGHAAVAAGLGAQASGGASTALGWNSRARGSASFATGDGGEANGGNSVAAGFRTVVDGNISFGFGFRAKATGDRSVALGSAAEANAPASFAAGSNAKVSHAGAFLWADHGSNDFNSEAVDEFAVRAKGGVRFVTGTAAGGTPASGVRLASGGSSWLTISDRNAKENFQAEDGEAALQSIASIPIESWNYKTQHASIRHIGPMAQDFYAAFGVGEDELHINTIDIDGVNMLAIQALEKRTRELRAENDALRARLAQVEAMLLTLMESRK